MKKLLSFLALVTLLTSSGCNSLRLSTFAPEKGSVFVETYDFEFVDYDKLPQPEFSNAVEGIDFINLANAPFDCKGKLVMASKRAEMSSKIGSYPEIRSYPFGWTLKVNDKIWPIYQNKYAGIYKNYFIKNEDNYASNPVIFYDSNKEVFIKRKDISDKEEILRSEIQCRYFAKDTPEWNLNIGKMNLVYNILLHKYFVIFDQNMLVLVDASTGKPKWGIKPKSEKEGFFASILKYRRLHLGKNKQSRQ